MIMIKSCYIYNKKTFIIINPMVPHLAEELWHHLRKTKTRFQMKSWPKVDLNYIKKNNVKNTYTS